MIKTIKKIFSHTPPVSSNKEEILLLEGKLQTLQLEIEAQKRAQKLLLQELEQVKSQEEQLIQEAKHSQLELLLTNLAPSISQLLTMFYLEQVKKQTIQNRDIFTVTSQVIRILEKYGLEIQSRTGEIVAYNPDLHTPLSTHQKPEPGELVLIQFAGIVFQDKLIRKAGVEKVEEKP